jgi:catechol 2,3-dioxygenase-like lactoylglutathione lyase family enzyme
MQLADVDVQATVPVKNLDVAKKFYEETLGLKRDTRQGGEEPGVVSYRCGGATLTVYESRFAGTNQATAATWSVRDDLSGVVRDLVAKGVKFEHYDMPGMKLEGDVHVSGEGKAAWLKDPDGNILALVGR